MKCSDAREALSAGLDGESATVPDDDVARHVAACPPCAAWLDGAALVTRKARLGRPINVPDLTNRVVAAVATADGLNRPRAGIARVALALVAVVQVALSLPALLSTGHLDAAVHVSREIGATDIALAVGVLAAAWRPWRAAGMLPVVAALAVGLSATTVVDVVRGHVPAAHEVPHLLALADAALLWRLRRQVGQFASPPESRSVLRRAA